MVAALIIVSIVLMISLAINFLLFKVLKNTFEIVDEMSDLMLGKTPRKFQEAYDGKYYPANVIATVKFSQPQEMIITDFSRYESHKLVGFTVYTKETMEEYYGKEMLEGLEEAELELIKRPSFFKDVTVYSPQEGMWTWK